MHTCPVGRYTKTFGRLTKVPGDFLPALGGLAEAMGKPAKPVGTLAWLLAGFLSLDVEVVGDKREKFSLDIKSLFWPHPLG